MELELVALIVSGASFVISIAALWATTLKRARIGLHHAANNDQWAVTSWNGLIPHGDTHLGVALYAHNGGANSGIIETLTVRSDATLGGVLQLPVEWYPVKAKLDWHAGNFPVAFPRALDAGEIEELFLVGRLPLSLSPIQRLNADEAADMEREENLRTATGCGTVVTTAPGLDLCPAGRHPAELQAKGHLSGTPPRRTDHWSACHVRAVLVKTG